MGFQLFLQFKRENDFTTYSIPIGSQPTIDIPVKQTPDLGSPCFRTPRAHISMISEYIGCLATILVRRERARIRVPKKSYSWEHQYFSPVVSSSPMFFWPAYNQANKFIDFRDTLLSAEWKNYFIP